MNKYFISYITLHAYNVGRLDYDRKTRILSEDTTLVVCLTSVGRCDSGRMPNSSWKMWLRSNISTPVVHLDFSRWVCRMSYHLSCEWLHMAELDDCSILWPRHVVRSRLGGMHDSFCIQNLNISQLRMCHMANQHLAWADLREIRVSRRIRYPCTQADQGLRMSSQVSQDSMSHDHRTKNWSHLGKILSSTNGARSRSRWSKTSNALWARRMMPIVLSTEFGITRWKIQTTRVVWWLWLIRMTTLNVRVQETMCTLSHG
jgi:hypothetical protein